MQVNFIEPSYANHKHPSGSSFPNGKRLLDICIASIAIIVLLPWLVVYAVHAKWMTGCIFIRYATLGKGGRAVNLFGFAGIASGSRLALWFNVLRGELSVVGPKPLARSLAKRFYVGAPERFAVRPGLISRFEIQRLLGVNYEKEIVVDLNYVKKHSACGDLLLLIRWTWALMFASSTKLVQTAYFQIFDVTIVNTTMRKALDQILEYAEGMKPANIAFVNADCLNSVYTSTSYRDVLNSFDQVYADGSGVRAAACMDNVEVLGNINGTDLFPKLCQGMREKGLSLYLLGGQPGVAESAAEKMQLNLPGLKIAGTQHGYFSDAELPQVLDKINNSGAAVILVGFGAPLQEHWIHQHSEELVPAVRIGVGGLFDFYAERVSRAPAWLREMGLEWTWRLMQEPGRMWKRYIIGNPLFLYRVWKSQKQQKKHRKSH